MMVACCGIEEGALAQKVDAGLRDTRTAAAQALRVQVARVGGRCSLGWALRKYYIQKDSRGGGGVVVARLRDCVAWRTRTNNAQHSRSLCV